MIRNIFVQRPQGYTLCSKLQPAHTRYQTRASIGRVLTVIAPCHSADSGGSFLKFFGVSPLIFEELDKSTMLHKPILDHASRNRMKMSWLGMRGTTTS